MSKHFLDDDYVPPPELAADFEAGRKAERDFESSPAQLELRKQQADELGRAIAKNLMTLCQ